MVLNCWTLIVKKVSNMLTQFFSVTVWPQGCVHHQEGQPEFHLEKMTYWSHGLRCWYISGWKQTKCSHMHTCDNASTSEVTPKTYRYLIPPNWPRNPICGSYNTKVLFFELRNPDWPIAACIATTDEWPKAKFSWCSSWWCSSMYSLTSFFPLMYLSFRNLKSMAACRDFYEPSISIE